VGVAAGTAEATTAPTRRVPRVAEVHWVAGSRQQQGQCHTCAMCGGGRGKVLLAPCGQCYNGCHMGSGGHMPAAGEPRVAKGEGLGAIGVPWAAKTGAIRVAR